MRFSDSRRLTGPNVYFDVCGVVLEAFEEARDPERLARWRQCVLQAADALAWPEPAFHLKQHPKGATLAFSAPFDQLYCATEVNEWAWSTAIGQAVMYAPGHADATDGACALKTLQLLAGAEAEPALMAFLDRAAETDWPVLADDDQLSIGFGTHVQVWPRREVPELSVLEAIAPEPMPIAMVTGSNGKTTSVRLLSAIVRASGLACGHCCTDGLFFNGELVEADDYSGPAGARATLRHPQVQAAVLETARGGLLRRGLACQDADVALVTNISEDHFGEYGVFTLDDLAQVKLSVAKGLRTGGWLVLNAADPMLLKHGPGYAGNSAWFAADWHNPHLQRMLAAGLPVCGVIDGHLRLEAKGHAYDLGAVDDMPLSFRSMARYNIENLAGTALSALLMGMPVSEIARTLGRFGSGHADNPGRLQSWRFADVQVLMDYAHNPEGMQGFLAIARAFTGSGRLAVLLGQAGNREDADIRKLAASLAGFHPDLAVLKDMAGYERGREVGEVPGILRDELLRCGMPDDAVSTCLDEVQAVRLILAWAQSGDVLALPVHGLNERNAVQDLLDAMQAQGWRSGQALPELPPSTESGVEL
jgi:UDP-N-acetylmuramyl tripeptide synthase